MLDRSCTRIFFAKTQRWIVFRRSVSGCVFTQCVRLENRCIDKYSMCNLNYSNITVHLCRISVSHDVYVYMRQYKKKYTERRTFYKLWMHEFFSAIQRAILSRTVDFNLGSTVSCLSLSTLMMKETTVVLLCDHYIALKVH